MQQLLPLVQSKAWPFTNIITQTATAVAAACRSGRCPARHYMQQLLPLVQSKAWPFTNIITHRLPLQQGVEAYKMFAQVTCHYMLYNMSVWYIMFFDQYHTSCNKASAGSRWSVSAVFLEVMPAVGLYCACLDLYVSHSFSLSLLTSRPN
jgi:hypothetical protein